jgi:DNA mismatch repair protein MutS
MRSFRRERELDELRTISREEFLEGIEARESNELEYLEDFFNNVLVTIEVRNTHKDKVPPEWIRKQTLVNAERYITELKKGYEAKILGAEEKIHKIESELFEQLVIWIATTSSPFSSTPI